MYRERFFCLVALALAVNCHFVSHANADGPSDKDRERAEELMAQFTANRAKFKRYAVAWKSEYSFVHHERPELSDAGTRWYICCTDHDQKLYRNDMLSRAIVNGESERTAGISFFRRKHEITWRYDNGQSDSLKRPPDEQNEQEELLKIPIVRFDPWDLPLLGGFCLEATRMPYLQTGAVELRLNNSLDLRALETAIGKYDECKYRSRLAGRERELHVRFARAANNYPVHWSFAVRQAERLHVTAQAITTWAKIEDAYTPISVETLNYGGLPASPTTTQTNEMTAYWVFDAQFPDSVFDQSGQVSPIELRDLIVEHAEKLKPLGQAE